MLSLPLFFRRASVACLFVVGLAAAPTASASHAWDGYHWSRAKNPFTLKLGDNLSSTWDPFLATTATDWSKSSVLDTTVVAGRTSSRLCRPTSGRVEVCNASYGNTGWLGVAQIWAKGSHITQGTVKLNDTYFVTAKYNTFAWKNLVMCQEVGHTLGLDHQDENFTNSNLGTCMDYTNDPTSNQHPNDHDYDELASIYRHTDASSAAGAVLAPKLLPSEVADLVESVHAKDWGTIIKRDLSNRASVFERSIDPETTLFTFVVWTNEQRGE